MKPKTNIALALFITFLLALVPLVVACEGEQTTTTTRAVANTTQAPVTTTESQARASVLDADRQSKLDEFLGQLEQNNKLMGGLVIAQDGQVVYENYVGFASVPDQVPNSQQTKFRIGSITKMFTATMVMQLVDEGRLTLDTKLASFYPQIGNADKITISEMLCHRSGIHDFTQDPELGQYTYTEQSKEAMVARIAGMAPDFEPDVQFSYSNSNVRAARVHHRRHNKLDLSAGTGDANHPQTRTHEYQLRDGGWLRRRRGHLIYVARRKLDLGAPHRYERPRWSGSDCVDASGLDGFQCRPF